MDWLKTNFVSIAAVALTLLGGLVNYTSSRAEMDANAVVVATQVAEARAEVEKVRRDGTQPSQMLRWDVDNLKQRADRTESDVRAQATAIATLTAELRVTNTKLEQIIELFRENGTRKTDLTQKP